MFLLGRHSNFDQDLTLDILDVRHHPLMEHSQVAFNTKWVEVLSGTAKFFKLLDR